MEKITKIWLGPLPKDSIYIQPFRLYYIQNGVEKNWDLMKVHNSVSIVIFNTSRNVLVFVKQFRPAVYYDIISSKGSIDNIDFKQFPPNLGITLELCAGIVDKNKSYVEIAQDEVLEECGYNVALEKMEELLSFRSNVGTSGAIQKMFYCEVTDDDKKLGAGGGIDDEIIDVVEYSIDEARNLVKQGASNNTPPSILLGVVWFLSNKAPKQESNK